MKFEWRHPQIDGTAVHNLVRELGISPLLARLLVQRDLADPARAWSFLNPSLSELHDPYLMRDMERVVQRILLARKCREKVLIYGDYDVDGITSTVTLRKALEILGVEVDYYIPKRLEEGYGIKPDVLKAAIERGFTLFITVDTGMRAREAALLCRQHQVDLIVTDHHLPGEDLPPAFAVLNPHRPDCPYPDKNLAAVGVTFKLIQALLQKEGREHLCPHFLKLVSIGTVADIVPLIGENRVMVKFGTRGLADPRNLGLRTLLQGVGLSGEVDFSDIGFRLAPRINAVTRMGGGREVVELFSVRDPQAAGAIVQEMNEKNRRRRREEATIMAELEATLPERLGDEQFFLVVSGENWHRGVIGIVASRLMERYYRPVLVLSLDGGHNQGSGRSVPGFNILEALEECHQFFTRFGGHSQAVGCTLKPEYCKPEGITLLSEHLNRFARKNLADRPLIPSLTIDSVLDVEEVSMDLFQDLRRLAPHGRSNPLPVFASQKMEVVKGPRVLKDLHLKFEVAHNGESLEAIWWKGARAADRLQAGSLIELAYTLSMNRYMGRERLQLTVKDLEVRQSET